MSRFVGADEQGQLQGANSSISGIANLFGPGLFTQVFAVAIGTAASWHLPGAPFLIAALLLAVAAVVAWRVTSDTIHAGCVNSRSFPARKSYSLPVSVKLGRQRPRIFSATCSGVGSVSGSSPGMARARMRVRVGPGLNRLTRTGVELVSAA